MASAVVGDAIYVIGGFIMQGVATNIAEVYDAAIDAWSAAPDYPIVLHHSAAVTHEGAIYVFGGYTTGAFVPTQLAFRLTPGAAAWTPLESLPAARGAHAAALVDGKAYLVGGVGLDGQLTTAVHVYDVATDSWSSAADLPSARDHLAATAVGGVVYAVGGRKLSLETNTGALEAYDPALGRWSALPGMPTPRGGIAAAGFRERLVVVGGEASSGTFHEVEAYDPLAQSWSSLPPMPTARHGLGVAIAGERLYVMLGGPRPGFTVSGAVESLGKP